MQKMTSFTYLVQNGEKITIKVTPVKVGPLVKASKDGSTLPANPTPVTRPTFEFTATRPVGQRHVVMIEYQFTPSEPGDAHYKIHISGSRDGQFQGRPVKKTTANKSPQYKFLIRQAPQE